MGEMKRSDELIQLSQKRALTNNERAELRESYRHEQEEDQRRKDKLKDSVNKLPQEDPLNRPRHRMLHKCLSFVECPLDYKCRNYDSSHLKCVNCELVKTDDVCKKPHIHNEQNFNKLIVRNRIDLDKSRERRA